MHRCDGIVLAHAPPNAPALAAARRHDPQEPTTLLTPPPEVERGRSRDLGATTLVALAALVVVGVTYWRLWYGVDLTDESFYVAVPWRLVHGARPFVDETAVAQQLVAILLYPFVRAYSAVVGVTGVVLFVRHLQFLLSLALLAAIVVGLRPVLSTRRAVLVALAAVAFVPFQIHSVSYNTLGSGLFTAGCVLGFASLCEPGRRGLRVVGGLCHGLAVFVYLPLLGGVAVCFAIRFALARGCARRAALALDLPALALPLAGLAALVSAVGFDHFRADFEHSRTTSLRHWNGHKLGQIAAHEWHTLRLWYLLLPALVLLALLCSGRRGAARLVVLALPLCVLPPGLDSATASLEYVAHYGWLALPLLPLVRRRAGARQLFAVCWVPALVAGLATAYTSSNGGVNAGVGFFPAVLVSSVFLLFALEGGSERLPAVPVVVAAALLVFFEARPVYRDGAIPTLTARVGGGAFAGLHTEPGKRTLLDRLRADLAAVDPSCRILFFDDFPAGYLLTRARPDATTVWVHGGTSDVSVRAQEALLGSYRRRGFPDVVVVVSRLRPKEPLVGLVRSRAYEQAVRGPSYRIFRRRGDACR